MRRNHIFVPRYKSASSLGDPSIKPRRFNSEFPRVIVVYVMVWISLLYLAFTFLLKAFDMKAYLYFSVVIAASGILSSFLVGHPRSLRVFSSLSTVTVALLLEEALLNGLHPSLGVGLALVAALALPLGGSILRLNPDLRYALQTSGLMFASRLVFIPFPPDYLKSSIFLPSAYALIIALVIAFLVVKRISLKTVGLTTGPYSILRQIGIGGSVGLVSGLVEYFVLKPSPIKLAGDQLQMILYVVIVMTVFVGLGEEMLFRGLVQQSYQKVLPAWSAIVMASIQFAVMHLSSLNPLELLFTYGMGVFFGYSFWKTRSLVVPVTAHSLGNINMFMLAAYPNLMLPRSAIALSALVPIVLLLCVVPWRRI